MKTKSVVITGSTAGIGYGLANSFLDLGCAVVISGRSAGRLDQAFQRLADKIRAMWACWWEPCSPVW